MRFVMIATLSFFALTDARADVVYFNNSAHVFQWNGVPTFNPPGNATYLDLTLSPQQTGSPFFFTNRFYWNIGFSEGSCTIAPVLMGGPGIARSDIDGMAPTCAGGSQSIGLLVRVFNAGESIGPSATWVTSAPYGYARPGTVPLIHLPGYIGCRISIDGQSHYGWVHLAGYNNGFSAEVDGWAYEALPDTPIMAGDTGCLADFNHDGVVNSQDFFDFLAVFFAGCP
jgi:hypothetical protein